MTHVEELLVKARGEFGVLLTVTYPSRDEVCLAIPGEAVHVSQSQPVCWPGPRAPDTRFELTALVLGVLYPETRLLGQCQRAVLALGQQVARLEAALTSAGQYTDVRVAELERRLALLQATCDSACAQVAQLSDEIGVRRRLRRATEADVSDAAEGH